MRTILVTGGAGFIGSNFIRYWLQQYGDDRVVNVDALTYAGNLPNLDDVVRDYGERYAFVHGSMGNYDLMRHLFGQYGPDLVVNFAAESHNSRGIVHPEEFYQTNVVSTQQLLQAATDAKVPRFHHISTCEVYGDLPLDSDESFSETTPYRPRTPYSSSKAASDLVVRVYGDTFKLPFTITNCCNNYGPYQFPEKLIPHNVARLLTGRKMTLYKSSRNRREWLHVMDHCRAIEAVLLRGRVGETYNVGSGLELDIEQVADHIVAALGLDASYKSYVDDRPGHDRRYLLDSSKVRRELGWEPQVSFEQGLRDTVQWYVDNRAWWEPLLKRVEISEDKWR